MKIYMGKHAKKPVSQNDANFAHNRSCHALPRFKANFFSRETCAPYIHHTTKLKKPTKAILSDENRSKYKNKNLIIPLNHRKKVRILPLSL